MTDVSWFRTPLRAAARDIADEWTREADALVLPRLDEVGAQPRPSGFGTSYVEEEYYARAEEQKPAWSAEGDRAARAYQARARGLDRPTEAIDAVLVDTLKEVQQAHAAHQDMARVLMPYVRREPIAKWRYWICWVVLWFGDTAGVWSAAITGGDIPYVAFGQACATGLAAACAGLVGSELKDLRMARARQRDAESLTDDEQRYRHLFTASDKGIEIVKLVGLLSLTVVVLLGVGIFALRSSIEGSASGLTFGLLAAATAIGSTLLGYSTADEVADLLARAAMRVARAERRHLKLAAATPPKVRAEADETARSILDEHQLHGQAAAKEMESLAWRVQRRNPQVFGHGFPAGDQGGVIGRRARRGGAA